MNKARRAQLNTAIDQIEALKLVAQDLMGKLAEARELVGQIRDDEQESFDNMPEGLQAGERGTDMENTISEIESVDSDLESLHDAIETTDFDDLITKLDEAKGTA
jgi:hypothetical protein